MENEETISVWRCQNECRDVAPYFGFIWQKDKPTKDDLVVPHSECQHQFIKDISLCNRKKPNKSLTNKECIDAFNKFIREKNYQIKATRPRSIQQFGYCITVSDLNRNLIEKTTSIIANEFYANFERETKQFTKFDDVLILKRAHLTVYSTACMVCLDTIADAIVLEHLEQCTGVIFSFDSTESLPIFKIV